jgi:glucokinase
LRIGIDIGGTKLAIALGDASGAIRRRSRRPTQPSADAAADVARIAVDVRQLLAEAGVGLHEIAAVGVSAPGPIDRAHGSLVDPPNLPGWRTVPLVALLENALGLPVVLENDADAAALAEWRFGAGRGFTDVVYLTMSTGIGAGLILGGRLYAGPYGGAGEFGHVSLDPNGPDCACGLRGCFEAFSGGAAWSRYLRGAAPPRGRVAELAGGASGVTPEHVVAAAREGDAWARAEFDRWLDYVARGIAVVAFAVAPQRILLGTIAVAAGEALCFEPLRERVRALVWPGLHEHLDIVPAALGEELGDLAGICAALQFESD